MSEAEVRLYTDAMLSVVIFLKKKLKLEKTFSLLHIWSLLYKASRKCQTTLKSVRSKDRQIA